MRPGLAAGRVALMPLMRRRERLGVKAEPPRAERSASSESASGRSAPRRRWLVGAGVVASVAVVGHHYLSMRTVLLALGLRGSSARTRGHLLTKHVQPTTGQVVFLLGTTHHRLFFEDDYSIWHVKSALQTLAVDTALVELLPEDLAGDRVGDGPVEMPFVVGVARERGLLVRAIDARWDGGWAARQDAMFALLTEGRSDRRAIVVVCGYMHLRGIRQRLLEDAGFVDAAWSIGDAEAAFSAPVERVLPRGFREALRASIARARQGRAGAEPFRGADPDWFITVRERVLSAADQLAERP